MCNIQIANKTAEEIGLETSIYMQEVLNQLHGCKVFSSSDLMQGFHQMPLTEPSKKFTAFGWGNRAFQYKYLLFGVKNGPSSYSRAIGLCLSGLTNVSYYIDDILIYTKDLDGHLRVMRQVF